MTPEEYHEVLTRIDELVLTLGETLRHTRIGWDDEGTCEGILGPINTIAKRIDDIMPQEIKATRGLGKKQ